MQNFFTKLNFAARLKMRNMNTISIRMSYLTVTPVLYILYFSKRKRWWHLKLTLERKHYFCQRSDAHSLIIATIAIHLFLKRLWIGKKNVPCTQNCNLFFIEQLNPYNYLYSQNFNNFALVYHWVQSFCAESMGISPHCFGSGSVIVSAHFGLRCLRSAKSFRFPCRLS